MKAMHPKEATRNVRPNEGDGQRNRQNKKIKCIDLAYINRLTKSDSKLMMEMISLYLEQTPPLITIMKQSLQNKDWSSLSAAAHKTIPSFSMMGISKDFEDMARKIQEYASTQQDRQEIPDLVLQLEAICMQACKELEEEFNTMKKTNS